MNILVIGNDKSILDSNSPLVRRVLEYGKLVDKYFTVVPDISTIKLNLNNNVSVYGSGGGNKAYQLLNVHKIARAILMREKIDVISVQDQYYLAVVGWLLAKKFKIGLEIQVHGFEKYSGIRKLIAKFVLPRAGACRVVSQRLKKYLLEKYKIQKQKITVVPIRTEVKGSCVVRMERNNGPFVFLTVSRLVPVKSIDLQIKALAEICKKGLDAVLWIVGEGPEYGKLELLAGELGVKEKVIFYGFRKKDDLADIYANADCFLLTSQSEGWGLAVLEAGACGLPIIMTDVGCAGEVVKNRESGLIVPLNDAVSLVAAMEEMMNNESQRSSLSAKLSEAIRTLPDARATQELYLESWRKAVRKSGLLILTQKIDYADPILGFFHRWVEKFSEHFDFINVICLEKGEYNLPANVNVWSLGKEKGVSRLKYVLKFYKYIWKLRKEYDVVFVHMNPEYLVLGGWFWKLLRKKLFLWFVHKSVNLKLRVAAYFADSIFTASKESCGLKTPKLKIVGHGIDVGIFHPETGEKTKKTGLFNIVYVGRISPIKNQKLLIDAANIIINDQRVLEVRISLVGDSIFAADHIYRADLRKLAGAYGISDQVIFCGSLPHDKIISCYRSADLCVNLCPTGGMDKAVLESLACGIPTIVANKTFESIFSEYKETYVLNQLNAVELAQKILNVKKDITEGKQAPLEAMADFVMKEYNLDAVIGRVIKEMHAFTN